MTIYGLSRQARVLGLRHPIQFLREITKPRDELTKLANRFGSDKGDRHFHGHYYTRIYAEFFAGLRKKPIRLLEIGLLHPSDSGWQHSKRAPSLMMWSRYFPNGQIFGFDIADFASVSLPGCAIYKGDSSSRTDLTSLIASSGGNFDIVIDDASHASKHQQIALAVLFPYMAPGGLYIIEDLHWQPLPDGKPKTRDFLCGLVELKRALSPHISNEEANYLEDHFSSIEFFDSLNPDLSSNNKALAVIRHL